MHIDDLYALVNRVYNLYDNGLFNADLSVRRAFTPEELQDVSSAYVSLLDVQRDLELVGAMLKVEENLRPDATHTCEAVRKAAADLGRLGGLKGGPARAEALTPERRSEIASKAAAARWNTFEIAGEQSPQTSETLLEAEEDGDEN